MRPVLFVKNIFLAFGSWVYEVLEDKETRYIFLKLSISGRDGGHLSVISPDLIVKEKAKDSEK
jgi:hypothetical protein